MSSVTRFFSSSFFSEPRRERNSDRESTILDQKRLNAGKWNGRQKQIILWKRYKKLKRAGKKISGVQAHLASGTDRIPQLRALR
jgi:hypothetical protein